MFCLFRPENDSIPTPTSLVKWYLRFRKWLGLRYCTQPVPKPNRMHGINVFNIGFGQYLKERVDLNEVLALQYASKWTAIPTSDLVGVWESDTYPGYFDMIVKRVPGTRLQDLWPDLDDAAKEQIAKEIKKHVPNMRALEQPEDIRGQVCSIARGAMSDETLSMFDPRGPWTTVDGLVDYLLEAIVKYRPELVSKYRQIMLPQPGASLVFTHGDLTPRNIIVHWSKGCHVSLIDWAYGGWLPEYWEAFNAGDLVEEERPDGWREFVKQAIGDSSAQQEVFKEIRPNGGAM